MYKCQSQVKMSDVKMSEVKMSEEKMSEVKMSDVKMSEVKMSDVKMSEVKMSDVNMSEVIMYTTYSPFNKCYLLSKQHQDPSFLEAPIGVKKGGEKRVKQR